MKRNRGALAGCLAFTVAGVVILVVGGDAESRATGLLAIVFFGGCALALAVPLLTRSGKGTVRIVDAGFEPGFLFPLGRMKSIVIVLACAGMAAGGVLILASYSPVVGLACALVFGVFWLLALVRLLRGDRGLMLTPTRVVVTLNGRSELAWDEIAEVALYGQDAALVLGISANDPSRIERSHTGTLASLNRSFNPADIVLPADQLAGGPEHALETLVAYLDDPQRRAAIGTEAELARVI